MAQHDYNIANATGFNFRADLNGALLAIVTTNSGSTEPAVTFPGQLWLDLSGAGEGVIRRRNRGDTAWLTDIGVDTVAREAASAAQTTANAAVRRSGDTMTGALGLPNVVPTGHQAVSRAQGDLLYQDTLPQAVAGSLLIGEAGGWLDTLTPGGASNVLCVTGGLPGWEATTTHAAPNRIPRTQADGTLDLSFIPAAAGGLRYRGTFLPTVAVPYPLTGGGGAAGAPAMGDFWVIDGLTTAGFTYVAGSLAGVTVYNGDSIAFDGETWFRMGSTVNLEGVMRTDGSTAMEADFNAGNFALIEVSGLHARDGNLAPMTGFQLDPSNIVLSPTRSSTQPPFDHLAYGQIGIDFAQAQIYVGGSAANFGVLPVRFHSAYASYAAGDFVSANGRLWRAPGAIAAGAFVATQWELVYSGRGTAAQFVRADGALTNELTGPLEIQGGTLSEGASAPAVSAYTDNAAGTASIRVLRGAGSSSTGWVFQTKNGGADVNALTLYPDGSSLQRQMTVVGGGAASGQSLPVLSAYTDNAAGTASIRVLRGASSSSTGWVFRTKNGGADVDALTINPDGSFGESITVKASSSHLDLLSPNGARGYRLYSNTSDTADNGLVLMRTVDGSAYTAMAIFHPSGYLQVINNLYVDGLLRPMTDNNRLLGNAAQRWQTVYAGTGTINTSDAREKTPIEACTASELAAANEMLAALGRYQWLTGNDQTRHYFGITAQNAGSIMTNNGLNPADYGMYRYDTWPATPAVIVDGVEIEPAQPAGDRYGLDYSTLHNLLLRALHDAMQDARNRLSVLEGVQHAIH